MDVIAKGDLAVIFHDEGRTHAFRVREKVRVPGLGVLNLSPVLGKKWGTSISIGDRKLIFIRPNLTDILETMDRKAQIIIPKDAHRMVGLASIGCGDKVLEVGAGSGGMTLVLLNAVGEKGRVISYDISEKNLLVTRKNVEKAFLDEGWEGKLKNPIEGIDEEDFDAVIIDVPGPERVVENAVNALKSGGVIVAYCPNVGQMEDAAKEMKARGLSRIECLEIIERRWVVHEGGARPDFAELGHTGFIIKGRRI